MDIRGVKNKLGNLESLFLKEAFELGLKRLVRQLQEDTVVKDS